MPEMECTIDVKALDGMAYRATSIAFLRLARHFLCAPHRGGGAQMPDVADDLRGVLTRICDSRA